MQRGMNATIASILVMHLFANWVGEEEGWLYPTALYKGRPSADLACSLIMEERGVFGYAACV